jgi:hypothetical protein
MSQGERRGLSALLASGVSATSIIRTGEEWRTGAGFTAGADLATGAGFAAAAEAVEVTATVGWSHALISAMVERFFGSSTRQSLMMLRKGSGMSAGIFGAAEGFPVTANGRCFRAAIKNIPSDHTSAAGVSVPVAVSGAS